MGWGWRAFRYIRRGRRRNFYRDVYIDLLSSGVAALAEKKAPKNTPTRQVRAASPPSRKVDVAPSHFASQDAWDWDEGDREYFRYATELWKVFTLDHWGVVRFPADSDAAWIFFEIAEQQQADNRGTLAHGSGHSNAMDPDLPVFLVFRLRDGYQKFFAAVQSWALVDHVITQDRPLFDKNSWPRASVR